MKPGRTMFFYSPSTRGFYTEEIHGANIPTDARAHPLTREHHAELLAGQGDGNVIQPGPSGAPVLAAVVYTLAQVATRVRADRDVRLAACDWATLRAHDRGAATPPAWATYRQALRDVPQQVGFPTSINWPEAPAA